MIPIELFQIYTWEGRAIHIFSQVKAEGKEKEKEVKGKTFHPFNTFVYVSKPM